METGPGGIRKSKRTNTRASNRQIDIKDSVQGDVKHRHIETLDPIQGEVKDMQCDIKNSVQEAVNEQSVSMGSVQDDVKEQGDSLNSVQADANDQSDIMNSIQDDTHEQSDILSSAQGDVDKQSDSMSFGQNDANQQQVILSSVDGVVNEQSDIMTSVQIDGKVERVVLHSVQGDANDQSDIMSFPKGDVNEQSDLMSHVRDDINELSDGESVQSDAKSVQSDAQEQSDLEYEQEYQQADSADSEQCETADSGESDDEMEHEEDEESEDTQLKILKLVTRIDKKVSKMSGRLNSLEMRMGLFESEVRSVKVENASLHSKVENNAAKLETLDSNLQRAKADLNVQKARNNDLEQNVKSLLEKQLALETYIRRENLLFHGVPVAPDEKCSDLIRQILKQKMKLPAEKVNTIKFQRCHRNGGKGSTPPIICRFALYLDREYVWNKRFNLKGSGIFLTEHFAPEIEERRRPLYPIFKEAKKNKMKASMKYDKVVIDGTSYDCSNLHRLPAFLHPAAVATESRNGITCFFTGASPLSNFYAADFKIEGETFDTVERYLQMKKAEYANSPEIVKKIKEAKSPSQCKALGDSIEVDEDEWLDEAKKIVKTACVAKFTQNVCCKRWLLKTGEDELAEAGPNTTWGIGMYKSNPRAFIQAEWQGKNVLGGILTEVRSALS